MRAARYHGREDVRIEDIPEPVCGPGQVKVKPAFVGICGSDVHEYLGGPIITPKTPHPVTGEKIPITLGHEFSGTVIEVGKGVTGFTLGQNVVVQPSIYDSTCPACKSDPPLINVCESAGFVGLCGWGGGLSSACVLPQSHVIPIPPSISLSVGALVEPLSVGWHAVTLSPLTPTSSILILGGGPIGIAVIYALQARAPKCKIMVSEVSSRRQEFVKGTGVSKVVDPREVNIIEETKNFTGGRGIDIVFDCAGVEGALRDACLSIAARGTIVNLAVWEKEVLFQPNYLIIKEGKFITSLGYVRKDYDEVIEAIASGAMKPESMITQKISLENVVEDGLKELINNKDKHVKILIEM